MVKLPSNPTCVLSDADVITNEQAERIAKVLTKHLPGAGDVTESGKILGVDSNGDVALVEDKTGSTYTAGEGLTLENGEFSVDNPMPGASGASQGDVLTVGANGPEWLAPEAVGGVEVVSGPYKPNHRDTSVYLTRGLANSAEYGPWAFNSESDMDIPAYYGVQAIQFYEGMALLPSSVVLSEGEYNIHLVVGQDSSNYAVYNESIGTFYYRSYALARAGFVQITQYSDDASKWTVVGEPLFVGSLSQCWVTVAGSTGGTAPNGEIAMCSCLDAGWDCSFLVLSYVDVSTLDFNKAYINSNMPQLGSPNDVLTVKSDGKGVNWAAPSGGTQYSAGDGISIANDTISAKVDGTTIQVNASGELEAIGGGGGSSASGYFVPFYSSYTEMLDTTVINSYGTHIDGVVGTRLTQHWYPGAISQISINLPASMGPANDIYKATLSILLEDTNDASNTVYLVRNTENTGVGLGDIPPNYSYGNLSFNFTIGPRDLPYNYSIKELTFRIEDVTNSSQTMTMPTWIALDEEMVERWSRNTAGIMLTQVPASITNV